jgi:hypothetical protein
LTGHWLCLSLFQHCATTASVVGSVCKVGAETGLGIHHPVAYALGA